MRHSKIFVLLVLIFLGFCLPAQAQKQIIFSARVVRIQPWGPIKISCGVALVTRLAEYEVDTVFKGGSLPRRILVRHLACNGDELDDLHADDQVMVVATRLKNPERHFWTNWPDPKITQQKIEANSEPVMVQYSSMTVAKQIYPTRGKIPR